MLIVYGRQWQEGAVLSRRGWEHDGDGAVA